MEPFFALADKFTQSSLHKVAYSALPDAPVQPYVEPRRRVRRPRAMLRRRARRPVIDLRPARYSTGC